MGIYTDLRSVAKSIDFGNGDGNMGDQRAVAAEISRLEASQGDLAYPTGTAAVNEVQEIAEFVQTGGGTLSGTFDLTINLNSGESIALTAVDFDVTAAALETLIDTEAVLAAGAISVSGGPMNVAPIVLTFDGAEVAGINHPLATTDVTSIVDDEAGGGAVTLTTEGQPDNPALGVLIATGVVALDGTDVAAPANGAKAAPNAAYPSQMLIRALAREAAIINVEAGVASVEADVLAAAGLS